MLKSKKQAKEKKTAFKSHYIAKHLGQKTFQNKYICAFFSSLCQALLTFNEQLKTSKN